MPSLQQPSVLTLEDIFAILVRRRRIAICTTLVVCLLVGLGLFRQTPLYEATATLALHRAPKPVNFEVQHMSYDPYTGLYEFSLLNTQRDLLVGRASLEKAIRLGGLAANPTYSESVDPVELMRTRLVVDSSKETWVLTLRLRDEDPKRAKQALEALLDIYKAEVLRRSHDAVKESLATLSLQVAEAEQKLQAARAAEREFRNRHGIISTEPVENFSTKLLHELNEKKVELAYQLQASTALFKQVEAAAAVDDRDKRRDALLSIEAVRNDSTVHDQQRYVIEAQGRVLDLAQRYLEKHPRLIEAKSDAAFKAAKLDLEIENVRKAIGNSHQALRDRDKNNDAEIARVEKSIGEYRDNLAQLQALGNQTEIQRKLYEELLSRLGQNQVSSKYDDSQMVVADPPSIRNAPVNIKPGLFIFAALAAGSLAGMIVPLLVEMLDRRVRGAVMAKELTGLPICGQLPYISGLDGHGVFDEPSRSLSESYRGLRTALKLTAVNDEGCRCLMIASGGMGDGKSSVAARLAISLAAAGSRVLLIDGDLRKPTLQMAFALIREEGLTLLLAGEPGISPANTANPNLDFMPVGFVPPNPAELLNSHCLPEWLTQCRESYDFILIDSPPLALVSDALAIGQHVDGILLVVRDGVTNRNDLTIAMDHLSTFKSKLVGLVVNGTRRGEADYGYTTPLEPAASISTLNHPVN